MRKFDINNNGYHDMLILISNGTSLSSIARHLNIKPPTVTEKKKLLLREGYIEQRENGLFLTEKGIAEKQALSTKLPETPETVRPNHSTTEGEYGNNGGDTKTT